MWPKNQTTEFMILDISLVFLCERCLLKLPPKPDGLKLWRFLWTLGVTSWQVSYNLEATIEVLNHVMDWLFMNQPQVENYEKIWLFTKQSKNNKTTEL